MFLRNCTMFCASAASWLTALSLVALWRAPLAAGEPDSRAAAPRYEYELRRDIEFGRGGDEPLLLDLALPKDAPGARPAIVFLHGGSWRGGEKSVGGPIRAAERGFVGVSINYRLAPRHKWPAQIEDAKCAVRWLRAHADELGVDPARVGAEGHSAGAHLAMLLGTLDDGQLEGSGGWADQSSHVQAVVSFAGPADMIDQYRYSTNAKLLKSASAVVPLAGSLRGLSKAGNLVTDFMGGEPRGELLDAYRLATPAFQVTADDAPMLLFQGTADPIVPDFQARRMSAALEKAGVPVRLELCKGVGHAAGSERNFSAALDFFEEQLRAETSE